MDVPYEIIRSDRRTVEIQITAQGRVAVRCPRRMRAEDIQKIVESKEAWIRDRLAKRGDPSAEKLTDNGLKQLCEQAGEVIPERVAHYAGILGVTYHRITIRSQRTRWGSCSSKGNLNFNCLLAWVPLEVLDYVVVHELCHRIEMNHSTRFWSQVERVLPDYKARRKWLKANGPQLMARLP